MSQSHWLSINTHRERTLQWFFMKETSHWTFLPPVLLCCRTNRREWSSCDLRAATNGSFNFPETSPTVQVVTQKGSPALPTDATRGAQLWSRWNGNNACRRPKHSPSHSLVGELLHAIKLLLHVFFLLRVSSESVKVPRSALVHPPRTQKVALRRSHCGERGLRALKRTTTPNSSGFGSVSPAAAAREKAEESVEAAAEQLLEPHSHRYQTSFNPTESNQCGRKKEVPLLPHCKLHGPAVTCDTFARKKSIDSAIGLSWSRQSHTHTCFSAL